MLVTLQWQPTLLDMGGRMYKKKSEVRSALDWSVSIIFEGSLKTAKDLEGALRDGDKLGALFLTEVYQKDVAALSEVVIARVQLGAGEVSC